MASRCSRITNVLPGASRMRWQAAQIPDTPAPMITTSTECVVIEVSSAQVTGQRALAAEQLGSPALDQLGVVVVVGVKANPVVIGDAADHRPREERRVPQSSDAACQ